MACFKILYFWTVWKHCLGLLFVSFPSEHKRCNNATNLTVTGTGSMWVFHAELQWAGLSAPPELALSPASHLSPFVSLHLLWMLVPHPVPDPISVDAHRTEWIRKCSQPSEVPSALSWSISKSHMVHPKKISPYTHRARLDAEAAALQICSGAHLLMANINNSSGFVKARV